MTMMVQVDGKKINSGEFCADSQDETIQIDLNCYQKKKIPSIYIHFLATPLILQLKVICFFMHIIWGNILYA